MSASAGRGKMAGHEPVLFSVECCEVTMTCSRRKATCYGRARHRVVCRGLWAQYFVISNQLQYVLLCAIKLLFSFTHTSVFLFTCNVSADVL